MMMMIMMMMVTMMLKMMMNDGYDDIGAPALQCSAAHAAEAPPGAGSGAYDFHYDCYYYHYYIYYYTYDYTFTRIGTCRVNGKELLHVSLVFIRYLAKMQHTHQHGDGEPIMCNSCYVCLKMQTVP